MKLILSLQPGSKVNVPIELGEEELVSLTVADFKAKIMQKKKTFGYVIVSCKLVFNV